MGCSISRDLEPAHEQARVSTKAEQNQEPQDPFEVVLADRSSLPLPSQSSAPYTYDQPLAATHLFRLLELHPAGDARDPLRGILRLELLDGKQRPAYETVSYAWGDASSRGHIELDGCHLGIPFTAEQALRQLRLPDHNRILWIDSICINQDDIGERERQVAMMGQIYSRGSCNLICLGPGNRRLYQAIRDLQAVASEMMADADAHDHPETLFEVEGPPGHRKFGETCMRCIEDYSCIDELFTLPWFRRLWVVQEAALSRSSICHIGPATTPLLDISRMARWMSGKRTYLPTDLVHSEGQRMASFLWNFLDTKYGDFRHRIVGSNTGWPTIITLLEFGRELKCSDGRDHIFGMLGLRPKDWVASNFLLAVSYEKTILQVMRDATRYALGQETANGPEGSLCRVFQSISLRPGEPTEDWNWLSWVPIWHRAWDPDFDPSPLHRDLFRADGNEKPREEQQSQESDVHYPPRAVRLKRPPDPNMYSLRGFVLDQVATKVGPIFTRQVLDSVAAFQEWLNQSLLILQQPPDDKPAASVLVAGTNIESQPATEDDLAGLEALQEWLSREQRFPPEPGASHATVLEARAATFDSALRRVCDHRRVFRTASGYIGVGPQIMQEGDIVVVAYHCRTPYVLRARSDGLHRILGECYVQGVMHGEAMREHRTRCNNGSAEDQTFGLV